MIGAPRRSHEGVAVGTAPQFTAEIESRNGVARIALVGELDMATAPILAEHMARVEQNGTIAVLLDLRDLTFVDSSGLHVFLEASKRAEANGHRLVMVGATQTTQRLFELTGAEFLLDGKQAVSVLDRFTGARSRRSTWDGRQDDAGD
jgi:anti-anti-sigma factor